VRRLAILGAIAVSAVVVPSSASARPPIPPLPCDYWIHGCKVTEYLCDAGICIGPITAPSVPVAKV
jgi:hypothetical protein